MSRGIHLKASELQIRKLSLFLCGHDKYELSQRGKLFYLRDKINHAGMNDYGTDCLLKGKITLFKKMR